MAIVDLQTVCWQIRVFWWQDPYIRCDPFVGGGFVESGGISGDAEDDSARRS